MQTKTRNALQTKPLDELMQDEEAQAMAEWRAGMPTKTVGQLMQEDDDKRLVERAKILDQYKPLSQILNAGEAIERSKPPA